LICDIDSHPVQINYRKVILADVIVDGENLSDLLIKKGLGIPYEGGTKPNWTTVMRKRA